MSFVGLGSGRSFGLMAVMVLAVGCGDDAAGAGGSGGGGGDGGAPIGGSPYCGVDPGDSVCVGEICAELF